jgi:hypothetical protein
VERAEFEEEAGEQLQNARRATASRVERMMQSELLEATGSEYPPARGSLNALATHGRYSGNPRDAT